MKKRKKICFVSSSGGHFEEIKCLSPLLSAGYEGFFVTENTNFKNNAKYTMISTGSNDIFVIGKLFVMFWHALYIWLREKPDCVITSGALICVPFWILSRLFKKKFIYIETFARVHDGSKTGKFMYNRADLFIIQWESLYKIYPNAVYGGSIF